MTPTTTDRAVIREARARLDEWVFDARERAYAELFEGEAPVLTEEERGLLDRIDSDLARGTGSGLWGADEYGIVTGDVLDTADPRVVCTYHPEIPSEGYRGAGSLSESTREEFNDVLWDYCERVADLLQADLDHFRRAWEGD